MIGRRLLAVLILIAASAGIVFADDSVVRDAFKLFFDGKNRSYSVNVVDQGFAVAVCDRKTGD